MTIKLSEWAKKNGLTYATCYRWFRDGALPVKAHQNKSTGTIFVEEDTEVDNSSTMELFLKTMNKFILENKSIIEFSAYVLNNFNLSSKVLPTQKINNNQEHIKNYVNSIMPEERKQEIKQKLELIKKSKDNKNINCLTVEPDGYSTYQNISQDELTQILSIKHDFPFFKRIDEDNKEIKVSEEEIEEMNMLKLMDKGE